MMRTSEMALAAALLMAAPAAVADARERCYGIALAGQNDGIGNDEAPGRSTIDFQGDAWVWVPTGTCLTLAVPVDADGSRRRGALEPLERDRP